MVLVFIATCMEHFYYLKHCWKSTDSISMHALLDTDIQPDYYNIRTRHNCFIWPVFGLNTFTMQEHSLPIFETKRIKKFISLLKMPSKRHNTTTTATATASAITPQQHPIPTGFIEKVYFCRETNYKTDRLKGFEQKLFVFTADILSASFLFMAQTICPIGSVSSPQTASRATSPPPHFLYLEMRGLEFSPLVKILFQEKMVMCIVSGTFF